MTKAPALCTIFLLLAACDYQSDPGEARTYDVQSAESAAEIAARPVQIGFDGPRFAACASYGEVTSFNPRGEDTLTVRAAPAGSADETDRLAAGSGVAMCQKVGGWIGIVYPPPSAGGGEGESIEERVNCGTGSPVPSARIYEGPCRSGWVREEYLRLMGSQS
jgi:hypothetical protein